MTFSPLEELEAADLNALDARIAALEASKYTKIAESILGAAVATVTFSSIPSTYRQLELWMAVRGDTAAQFASVALQFNSDTGTNYNYENWQAAGASTTSAETLSATSLFIGDMPANTTLSGSVSIQVVKIPWYAGTAFWKATSTSQTANLQTSAGQASALFDKHLSGLWRSTAAINRVDIKAGAGNFVVNSSFALYGLP